ncbi:MAG: adenylyl-sulfate kinase [Sphingobacteriales bacterium]
MLLIQFTGLSGCGKSTISANVKKMLNDYNLAVEIIDGDVYRQTLCKDLGFSKNDRCENIRRLGDLAFTFTQQGIIAIIAAINPYEEIRDELKTRYGAKTVWIDCAMDELIKRDTKGLYKRALLAEGHPDKINNLTGVNDVYEIPANDDLRINSNLESIEQSTQKLFDFIMSNLG